MSKMDELIKDVNKQAKEEIMSVGIGAYDYERIPFTSPQMNYCLFGGLPVGKLIEFYGEEHGGKTTSALDIIGNYQKMYDKKVLFIDAENTLDVVWATKLGVNVDDMYILQPKSQSAEEIFDIICNGIETDEIGLWILDSIGSLMSSQEWDENKSFEDRTYGGISLPLTRFSKKAEMLCHKHQCTGIGINQMRDKINSPYGGKSTVGGNAWRHLCAVRLEFRRGSFVDKKGKTLPRGAENPQGNIVQMAMIKNKTCPPTRRIGQYTLNYLDGIDYLRDLVEIAIKYDIVNQSGSWFTITDIETGELLAEKIHGQNNVNQYLIEHEDVLQRVDELVEIKMQEQ